MTLLNDAQTKIVAAVGRRVDAWRGFPLQGARVGYMDDGRYEPVADGERPSPVSFRTRSRRASRRSSCTSRTPSNGRRPGSGHGSD